jgi:soluble lytic murein transglycosylase-like protein
MGLLSDFNAAAYPDAPKVKKRNPIDEYDPIFGEAAEKYGVPSSLIKAVAVNEWGGGPANTSPTGNKGVMQLSDALLNQYGIYDPFDPYENIMGGARYLRELLDTFPGNTKHAIAA